MKIKFLLVLLVFFVGLSTSYASFPVERTAKTTSNSTLEVNDSSDSETIVMTSPAVAKAGKDKWVGVALWFFLGIFAAHRWYYGKPVGWNILFILTAGGLGVWAIIDLINMLTDNF